MPGFFVSAGGGQAGLTESKGLAADVETWNYNAIKVNH